VTKLGEMAGYQQSELDEIQRRWELRFPPDLVELMLRRRPLVPGGFDWLVATPTEIANKLEWPMEGFVFDILENDLWWSEWGPKPHEPSEQVERVRKVLAAAPKLIPLYAHRYLPEQPFERGNPVFSVMQSDVVYYGTSVDDWLVREEHGTRDMPTIDPDTPPKEIPFWSQAVRENNQD
jgi:hypothetical protein